MVALVAYPLFALDVSHTADLLPRLSVGPLPLLLASLLELACRVIRSNIGSLLSAKAPNSGPDISTVYVLTQLDSSKNCTNHEQVSTSIDLHMSSHLLPNHVPYSTPGSPYPAISAPTTSDQVCKELPLDAGRSRPYRYTVDGGSSMP